MLSIIIPALNEQPYLNRTIENIYRTCSLTPEVIVVDQGGNGQIDPRAIVISPGENVGERRAMNLGAAKATNAFLLRIDAHCDFSPDGWDVLMCEATGEKDLTIAVLTAMDKDWNWLGGHWYGLCRIIINEDEQGRKGLECKWQKPNRDHSVYRPIEPNMGATGCGMMIRKAFYDQMGGADESLPKMGAIGEEFAIKVWANGGKCQTRTDTMIAHIFGTGGYSTDGVRVAQQALWDKYGHVYPDVAAQFPHFEGLRLIRTDQPGKDVRTVIVTRTDTHDTHDPQTGKLIRRREERFRYVWLENEHPEEKHLTEKQVEDRYAARGTKVGQTVYVVDEQGNMIAEEN